MNDIKNISQGYEIDEVVRNFLNNTLREMMTVIKAECGSLFLFDSDSKELVLNSFYNSESLLLNGLRKKVGDGVAGKVVNICKPILVKDLRTDLRFRRNGFNHYRTNSFISIPLFTCKGLLGLINLADKSGEEFFTERDLEVAVTISKYMCFTIDSFNSCLELKQETETLSKQKSLLEKYASVGKLAAGVVHEINNPLDGVIRYTNILLEQTANNSAVRDYLLEVKRGLSRITNITKSLLDFSRQVNFHSLRTKKYANLNELIDDSLNILTSKVNGSIDVHKKYNKHLPRILDYGLSHVFVNIIKNAFDAMPSGGRLDISTAIKDSKIEVSFEDTGSGMPSDIIKHIFDPFFTTKGADKGTGFGLAISKEIIIKYGGRIDVESTPEVGSKFTVVIPKKYLENE